MRARRLLKIVKALEMRVLNAYNTQLERQGKPIDLLLSDEADSRL